MTFLSQSKTYYIITSNMTSDESSCCPQQLVSSTITAAYVCDARKVSQRNTFSVFVSRGAILSISGLETLTK